MPLSEVHLWTIVARLQIQIVIIIGVSCLNQVIPPIQQQVAVDQIVVPNPGACLMMREYSVRCKDVSLPLAAYLQTKVNVLICGQEMSVEASD